MEKNLVQIVKTVKAVTFAFIRRKRIGIVVKGVIPFEIRSEEVKEEEGYVRPSLCRHL